ncbi:arginine ABC transporter permease ArtM [Vibrio sp. S4M6]|uniref:arginine ABC transporter permease ArtM n=1 Tax=Vibrio sinus TaxID=2946865 RepID=UPI00202AA10E|nr:arginine ABC transporter permease ArtM [Vibrio sinus]MCL9780727.1 arginine ABC transporter permease ArtM [Vibrio sinus]
MNEQYFFQMLHGLLVSIELTALSVSVGLLIALLMTVTLIMQIPVLSHFSKAIVLMMTGTPLLVQIYLMYYGPGQFQVVRESSLWVLLQQPWFCAIAAFSINTAAYTTHLLKSTYDLIPKEMHQVCRALGMATSSRLKILMSYAFRRAIPAYSNEVILVFKGTSLASTITLMDLMGYAEQINTMTYDTLAVFGIAGALYFAINTLLSLMFRQLEKHALGFELNSSHERTTLTK